MATQSAFALLLTLVFAGAPQDQGKPADRFVLDAGEHDLVAVIEASGRFLGRNYMLAPSELPAGQRPTIKVQKKLELDAAGCEAVVTQFAFMHHLIATPLDRTRGIWEFLNLHGARRGEAAARAIKLTPEEVRKMRDVKLMVTTTVPLQHARATVVAQTLRPFLAGSGGAHVNLGTAGNERLILLQGLSDMVAQALDLIAEADQPQPLGKVENDRLTLLENRVKALEEAVKRLEGGKAK